MKFSPDNFQDFKDYLEERVVKYNCKEFIENDPISFPHRFSKKQDIEIIGFLMATISWGNRKAILKSGENLLSYLGNSPHEFVTNVSDSELNYFQTKSIHRTFKGEDFIFFVKSLRRLYAENLSMENLWLTLDSESDYYEAIERFRKVFIGNEIGSRSTKHISSTYKNSAAKRLMMFLRWMVRKDNTGVDLGIWTQSSASKLSIPLDLHTGNVARTLQLLSRKQNDWQAVRELDVLLRKMDANDPAKYDFALFGIGVNREL